MYMYTSLCTDLSPFHNPPLHSSYVWKAPFNYITETRPSTPQSMLVTEASSKSGIFSTNDPLPTHTATWHRIITLISVFNAFCFADPLPSIHSSPALATHSWPVGQGWLKANVGQYGVYRVNYERGNWDRLISYLRSNPSSTVS